jgi:hypothetical protein
VHVCGCEISFLPFRNEQILGQAMPRNILVFVTKERFERVDGGNYTTKFSHTFTLDLVSVRKIENAGDGRFIMHLS